MDLVYYDPYPNTKLEAFVKDYADLLQKHGERGVTVRRVETVEEVLKVSDVVSLHCNLDASTTHLMNQERLKLMKKDAILVNAARYVDVMLMVRVRFMITMIMVENPDGGGGGSRDQINLGCRLSRPPSIIMGSRTSRLPSSHVSTTMGASSSSRDIS
jgi:hypothetical protein